jgi:hypothetical protein
MYTKRPILNVPVVFIGGAVFGAIIGGVGELINPSLVGSDAQKYFGISSVYDAVFFGIIAGAFFALVIFLPVFLSITRNRIVSLYQVGVSSGVFVGLLFVTSALVSKTFSDQTSIVASVIMVLFWLLISLFLNLIVFRRDLLQKFLPRSAKK